VRLYLLGVRGSTPSPGPDFVRYGGNTSCIALGQADELPRLVVDAGTGLQRLTKLLAGQPFRGTILLSHLHWDHTHGFPFTPAVDGLGAEVDVLLPAQGDPVELMERILSPPHFPITPGELRGRWTWSNLEPGEHVVEGYEVLALEIPHKGGRMFGYRISDATATIAYLCDHSPVAMGPGPDGLGEYHEAARSLCRQVDVLLHDAQHTAEEFPSVASYGHSAIEYAVGLAEACDVGRLLLFHHSPTRTDDELDAILAAQGEAAVPVEGAREETVIDLGAVSET
jgi:phosphoribosyl 1,2-cyclic phosphodiesterase